MFTVGNSDNDNYAFYYMDADGEAIVAVSPDGWEDVLTQGKITVTMVPGENLFKARYRFRLYRLIFVRIRINRFHRFRFRLRFRIGCRIIATTCHKTTHGMEDFMNSGKEYIMLGVDKKLVGTPVTVGNSDNDNYAFYYMFPPVPVQAPVQDRVPDHRYYMP